MAIRVGAAPISGGEHDRLPVILRGPPAELATAISQRRSALHEHCYFDSSEQVEPGAENSRRGLCVASREPVVPASATGAYDCGDRQHAPTVLQRLERAIAVAAGVDIEHDDI
jgi:hypothetical protein